MFVAIIRNNIDNTPNGSVKYCFHGQSLYYVIIDVIQNISAKRYQLSITIINISFFTN